jgi:hypothetical protein
MRSMKFGRPSPALAVAAIALFVALGGTAFAATQINGNQLKPKSVGGGKLKQFTGGLLKKQSVGAGKVKKDTLGGFQIDENRLGTVPSAQSVAGDARYDVKVAFGQTQTLATIGPVTLTGQCLQNVTDTKGETGRDVARVLVASGEANTAFSGSAASMNGGSAGLLQPANGNQIAIEYSVPTGAGLYLSGGHVTAYTPSGAGLVSGSGQNAAALNLFGASCTFQGAALQS